MRNTRMTYERPNQRANRRPAAPGKPKGLKSSTFIMILLAIGAILYFISG